MAKNEIYWAIFSEEALLNYTIRDHKQECISMFLSYHHADRLQPFESCRKVLITEWKKEGE